MQWSCIRVRTFFLIKLLVIVMFLIFIYLIIILIKLTFEIEILTLGASIAILGGNYDKTIKVINSNF